MIPEIPLKQPSGPVDSYPMDKSAEFENSFAPAQDLAGPVVMLRFTDLMIDIEALSSTPDSAPAQVGLVFFDRDDPARVFQRFSIPVAPMDAILRGFEVTAATIRWWHEKGMVVDLYAGTDLTTALQLIRQQIDFYGAEDLRVQSRGNSYDLAILKLAYHRNGIPLPWNHWRERDVRTWLEGCQFKSPRKNDHDALQDAVNQALDIIEATAAIPDQSRENPCIPAQPMQADATHGL